MSNKIRVIVTDVNTGKGVMDSYMQYAPRCSDELRIDTPRGGWDFYEVKRVVWGMGGLASYLYLGVEPLPGRLHIGEQPPEDQPIAKKDEGEYTSCAEVLDDWFNGANIQGVAAMETVELVEMLDCMRDIERGMQRDIAFYRSCLNSGKTPKDGDEPSAQIKEKRIMSEHTTKQTKQDAAVAAYRAARADAFTTKAIADAVQAKAAVAKAKSAYIRADKKAAYYQAYTKRYAGAARHRVKTANAKVKAAKADYEKTKAMYLNPGDLTMAEIIEDLMERVMELEAKSNI